MAVKNDNSEQYNTEGKVICCSIAVIILGILIFSKIEFSIVYWLPIILPPLIAYEYVYNRKINYAKKVENERIQRENENKESYDNLINSIKEIEKSEFASIFRNFIKQNSKNFSEAKYLYYLKINESEINLLFDLINQKTKYCFSKDDLRFALWYFYYKQKYVEFSKNFDSIENGDIGKYINTFLDYYGDFSTWNKEEWDSEKLTKNIFFSSINSPKLFIDLLINKKLIHDSESDISMVSKMIIDKHLELYEFTLRNTSKFQVFLEDIDLMSGYEFEDFLSHLFSNIGYDTENTPLSNDQGADLIIKKEGKKIAVQAKNYGSKVSNKSVQEIVASLKYYDVEEGIVVTNNYFTESAKKLAEKNHVSLIDRDKLKSLIEKYPVENTNFKKIK